MNASRLFGRGQALLCGPIGSAEARQSAALHRESFAHSWPVQEFEVILSARETIADGLVDASGTLKGMAITRVIEAEGEILTIAVASAHRGYGNGALLLEHHLSHLAYSGVKRLILEVSDENLAAKRLYEKFNFKRIGHRLGYYKSETGRRSDALVLAKDL